jgi:hypothetical protein
MRALSNPEFVQFFADNPDAGSTLAATQSQIVAWSGMAILVYRDANGDLWTSDVSDAPQLANVSMPGYGTSSPQSMLNALPAAIVDTIKDDAAAVGALANQTGQAISGALAAGAAGIQGAVGDAETILIAAAVVLGLLFLLK